MAAKTLQPSLRRGLRIAAAGVTPLALSAYLAACSFVTVQPQTAPEAGPGAGYLPLIAARLKGQFKKPPADGLEISQPRWFLSNNGWSWQTCARFQDQGRWRTYALYFDATKILDGRYAVLSDDCGTQTYTPFDLETAKLVPQAVGTQGPIY
jgi:hypothetical protein